ncbi:TetR family transcriptional regulator [Actinocatenispora thailandica]|uniref:TetR family transcriptional regulator n=1 Tax=Actinocatenispora thailandica TaxID=227318 RepID=A0A7R7DKK6_9ACTN|nr:TetR/AcrR family transcriptional regulator [Actinocatenispora thailandica]BCJ33312.1 TetR family transcriptional regulator [Actinocatenispora thailandica]
MSIQSRRERERAERHQLIVTAARELAEAEGWDAVTTRRLAARIEYSQPVLYSHFRGKEAIMRAAALEGIGELTDRLRAAREGAADPAAAMRAVAAGYVEFAERQPALYAAMFTLTSDLSFGTEQSPATLRAAFGEFAATVRPFARPGADLETLTETFWAALHGLVALDDSHRLRPGRTAERVALLVDRFLC